MLALDGVRFQVGSQERRVRFTYTALIALHDLWGDEFAERVANAIIGQKLQDLISILVFATGIKPQTPAEFEAERKIIIEACPPIRPMCLALETAWAYAYHGFEAATRFAEVSRREAEAQQAMGKPAKKTFLSRFTSAFATLTRTRSAPT